MQSCRESHSSSPSCVHALPLDWPVQAIPQTQPWVLMHSSFVEPASAHNPGSGAQALTYHVHPPCAPQVSSVAYELQPPYTHRDPHVQPSPSSHWYRRRRAVHCAGPLDPVTLQCPPAHAVTWKAPPITVISARAYGEHDRRPRHLGGLTGGTSVGLSSMGRPRMGQRMFEPGSA